MLTNAQITAMLAEPPKHDHLVVALKDLFYWNSMNLPPELYDQVGQLTPFGVAASILEYYEIKDIPTVKIIV